MSIISSSRSEGGAPNSLETERRKTMRIIHTVERELDSFRERVVKKVQPQFPEDIGDCVQFVMDRAQAKRYPRNTNEFLTMLAKVRDAALVMYKTEVDAIEHAIETYMNYEEAMTSFEAQLMEAITHHIGKYCHSFIAETGPHDIPTVQFYENNITHWRGQIKDAFHLLDDIKRNMKDSSSTFELFMTNYSRTVHYMTLSLDIFPRVFNAIKDWITSDEAYSRRILDDISELKREKLNLDSLARRNKHHVDEFRSKVTRSQHHSKKLKEKMHRVMDDRKQCRRRELSIIDKASKVDEAIKTKKKQLTTTLENLNKRSQDSPRSGREEPQDDTPILTEGISKLEKTMKRLKVDLRTVKIERVAAQKEFHRMQVLCEKNNRIETEVIDDAHDASQDARDAEEEKRIMGEKIAALTRIRSIKLNPNTVKVIFYEGYTPGRKFDASDPLEEACKVTASDIGKDWPSLYQNLPFSPIRDANTRLQDITSLDSNPAPDSGRGAAFRSLERWKRLSQEASVNALTRTLKAIKKQEVAAKVEKKVVTVN